MRPKLALPLLALVLGGLGAVMLVATAPRLEVRPPEPTRPLVRVVEVRPGSYRHVVRTHGTVAPRTEGELVPEVSGRVVWVSPDLVPGGFFDEGAPLLRIDPADYRVALERARAALVRSESQLELARKDLERQRELRERSVASDARFDDAVTVERVAVAALRESRAALEQAERDLERTSLLAPYRGRVRSESADVGQFVARGVPLASLYAVDYAEVRLPLPDEDLAYVEVPLGGGGPQPKVELRASFVGAERSWSGRVVRTEAEIDPRTRMVHVVARVDDPYGKQPPLAVGLFVEAEIEGRTEEAVVVLPRGALRPPGRVLVVDEEDRLRFREVEVVRAGREEVVIGAGLSAGERVCVSPLERVVEGMRVSVVEGS